MNHRKTTALFGVQGFTLIEVLITAAVMSIGLLAMAQMQIVAIHFNADNRAYNEAAILATGQLECLKTLPSTPPNSMQNVNDYWLTDVHKNPAWEDTDGDEKDLTNITGTPDHQHPDHPVNSLGYPVDSGQERFGVFWFVEDGVPATELKTIAVTVSWYSGRQRSKEHITVSTVIAAQG